MKKKFFFAAENQDKQVKHQQPQQLLAVSAQKRTRPGITARCTPVVKL